MCELLRIGDLIRRDEPGPDRPECVVGLALGPLPGALGLEFALGEIVDGAIARDMRQRVALGDVLGAGADDDAEFHFPVRLLRFGRDGHVVERPGQAAHLLGEDHRLGRNLQSRFGGVVGIIEADGDEFLRIGDAGADPRLAAHQRQRFAAWPS